MTTEQKHLIDIPGLPEGWRAVAYRLAKQGEHYWNGIKICYAEYDQGAHICLPVIIVEKIKPRSIVLEDTGEVRQPKEGEYVFNNGNLCLCRKPERYGS